MSTVSQIRKILKMKVKEAQGEFIILEIYQLNYIYIYNR